MPLDQSTRQIAIDTPLGANVLVLRNFTATEELGRLFQIDAELLSEDFQIAFKDIVGQNVTIRLNTIQADPRFFNGHIRAFRQTGIVERLAHYHAVIVPKLWFLTRSADCRIFQNKTVPDIVKEILRDRGIAEIEDKLTGNYGPWEYCVQYRETDFNFVSRLMEQEGIYYYFKHANGNHTIVLADSDSTHPTFPGYADIPFQPSGKGVVDLQGTREWVVAQELQPGSYILNDYDFEKPKTSLLAPANIERPNVESSHEMYDYPGEYVKFDDGKQYARTRIEELQVGFETAHGSGEVRGIAAGFTFNLTDAARSDDDDSYLAVSAIIHAESEGYLSDGSVAGDPAFDCSFTAIRASTPFRPARLTPKPIIQGAQTAVVTGPKGEEIYTDKYGRVKVQFHWDRKGKHDENTTCWIRVAESWAGKRWGSTFTPRIGQEVVVSFLEGDPDQPLIIGSVYNGDQMPPYLGEGLDPKHKHDPKVSGVKSCSTKGGQGFNELRFDDNKGKEQIFLHAEKDLDTRVRNDTRTDVGGSTNLTVGFQDKSGELHGFVKEKIFRTKITHALKTVAVYADKAHAINAGKNGECIQLMMDGTIRTTAQQIFSVKAGMTVLIEAGAEICLKCGANFIQMSPAGIFINGTMVFINSGGTATPAKGLDFRDPLEPDVADNSKSGLPSNPST